MTSGSRRFVANKKHAEIIVSTGLHLGSKLSCREGHTQGVCAPPFLVRKTRGEGNAGSSLTLSSQATGKMAETRATGCRSWFSAPAGTALSCQDRLVSCASLPPNLGGLFLNVEPVPLCTALPAASLPSASSGHPLTVTIHCQVSNFPTKKPPSGLVPPQASLSSVQVTGPGQKGGAAGNLLDFGKQEI